MRLFTVVFLAAMACNRNDPMGPSPVPSPPPVPAVRPGVVVLPGGLDTFSCADADEVRVRVNSVEDNRVGLHVRISGIPEGGKRLRVRWRRDVVRDVRIGSAEDSFSDVLSYVYGGLTGPETFVVRVELLVDGRSGSCSRNRRVRVRPPASAHDGGSSDADTTGTGSDTDTTGTGSDTDTTGTGSDASVWKPGDNYYGELHSREWSRLTVDGLSQGQPIENGIPVYDTPFTVVCGFVGDVSVGCRGVIGEVVETGGSAGEWVRVPVEE